MNTSAVRWNLVVSADTDRALRQFLAGAGGRKGDLSRFVEEAVLDRIWELTVRQVKEQNAEKSQQEIETAIDEALTWSDSSS